MREEAIAVLEESKRQNEIMRDNPSTFWASHQMAAGVNNAKRRIEALDVALSALRPVSREQVEKVWRGCPECKPRCGLCIHIGAWDKYGKPYVCEQCADCSNFKSDQKFCEVCGAPMTDEAAQMVMERMETLHENRD